jgi:hypothetical protein
LKRIRTLTKKKKIKIKRISTKINKKTIHYQLGLNGETKNNKTFIKGLRKKKIKIIKIKLKTLIHDKNN